jgi:3-oxoacyl-[acyl-carrier protein] reductase
MRLQGKVAIITGAARGIGLAIAQRFVKEGAQVALADRLAAEVTAEAGRLGPAALAIPADVGDAAEVRRMVAGAVERFGRLDCMVRTPRPRRSPLPDLTEEEFDRVIA